MNIMGSIIGPEEKCCDSLQAISPTILDNLKRRQRQATERLNDLNAAIDAMEKNPEIAKVLELIAKAN